MVTIRMAAAEDAARLAGLARRLFHETFAEQNTPENMSAYLSTAFSEARQAAEIADPATTTLIAETADGFVGYAQLRAGEPPACVPDAGAVELVRLYVDRALHGRSVAHMLMQAALEAASDEARSMWLGVWERNPRAIAFYRKCGFVDVGSHVFQLGDDPQVDRIMWRARLDPI